MKRTRSTTNPVAIALRLSEDPGCDRRREPVTSGVPWPRGQLQVGDGLALRDARGRRQPLQARSLAFWPDGSVKWSLLTARIDAHRGRPNRFTLTRETGAMPVLDARNTAPADGRAITPRKTTKGLLIDTGRLRLTVATTDGGLIRELQVQDARGRWRQMLQPGGLRLYVTRGAPDGSARVTFTNGPDAGADRRSQPLAPAGFETNAVDPTYQVSVIEQGTERIGLRLAGTHVDADGQRFCPYVIHLYAYRDSTRLDVQHTLVYTGLPATDLIAGFGLTVPLRLGKPGAASVVPDDTGAALRTEVQATPAHPRWVHSRVTQLLADGYRFEKWTGPDCGRVKMLEGRRHPGWAHLGDAQSGCLVCLRDFWQQYPKAFTMDADRGTLTVELWPENTEAWDLRRYSHDFFPDLYEYARPDLWKQFPEASHGARGIAKTHELSLFFHGEPLGTDALEHLGKTLGQPLFLAATPEWYCGTGALGTVAPVNPDKVAPAEAVADGCADFMLAEQERCRWYGMVDYGDFQMTHAREDFNAPRDLPEANVTRWLPDVGGHAWINTEARPDQWLWLTFFRTGRTDCLRAAAAMTRHNRDIDGYHWGNFKGSGSRHNVNHWGCADKEWRISMPISLRWHHYLTGDPWTRETMTDSIATYQRYRTLTTSLAPSGTAALCGLMVKAELSGEAADFEVLRNLAAVYTAGVLPSGAFAKQISVDLVTGIGSLAGDKDMGDRMFFLLGFGGMQVLIETAELLNHQPLLDALTRHASVRATRSLKDKTAPAGPAATDLMYLHLYALAWRQTANPLFRRRIGAELRRLKSPLVPQRRRIAGVPVGSQLVPIASRKQVCYFGDIGMQLAFAITAAATPTHTSKGDRK